MTDTLQKLFGSNSRLKLLRLFLFNPKSTFSLAEAAQRSQCKSAEVRCEFALFLQIGLIKKARRGSQAAARYQLNNDFEYTLALQNLLLNTSHQAAELYELVRHTGTIKFIAIAGVLLGEWEDSRLDLFIVGERLNDRKLLTQIRKLESELGKELRFASLSTDQFYYRLQMNDHLVKDIFDYPHAIIFDKLNIGLK
ncbi:MAG TPA: hypothetical protein VN665_00740 [Candidatus Paceibacterota bacterium]|nr:hypothetical protein [Candidatus Paceibacterota bacterium]